MHDGIQVCQLPKDRASRTHAVDVLSAAFANDIMWGTLLPDERERARILPSLWQGVIGYCLRYGMVYSTNEIQGVAAWTLPGKERPTFWRLLRTGFGLTRSVFPMSSPSRRRFLTDMKEIDALHRQVMSEPHWYLWALGVQPDCQGKGIGGGLLRPILERSAGDGIPCYLETETEENVAFYQRRGFEVVREADIGDPAFKLWFMVRNR